MPQGLIPIFAALITAGGSAYAAKTSADASGDATKASQQQLIAQQRQEQQNEANARRQAMMKAAPGLQENVGGSLTPDSFSAMIAQLTGSPGNVGMAQSTLFPQNGLQQNQGDNLSGAMDHLWGGGSNPNTPSLTMPY